MGTLRSSRVFVEWVARPLDLLLELLHLLLKLRHLLFVDFDLLIGIAHNESNIARNRAQAQQLSAAVESALGADSVRAFRRIVVAYFQRKSGVDNYAVFVSVFDLGVNRHVQLAGQMDNYVPGARLGGARTGRFCGSDKPGGDAAITRRGFDRAIHLRQIDTAAVSFK